MSAPNTSRAPRLTGLRRLEYPTVLVAVGLIALHVLDDNFLQPEPGMSAGDHVLSGLVPLVALGLAAAAYPRLRPGARAVVAIGLGFFGIAAGLEGWYYATKVGASGDDYTSLVALPAGVLLLVVAALTLWRSRRLDESRRRRYSRRALIAIAGLVASIMLVIPIVYSYGGTHLGRAVVPAAELRTGYEDVSFTTKDGLELEGWYVPSQNRAAVIAVPGRKGSQRPARMLARHGYGVLLFDRRGEGDSEGEPNAWGWDGVKDIEAAIAFLSDRPDVDPRRIGGIGLSVGGELLLETAVQTPALRAVVSEGAGIRSVREQMHTSGAGKWLALPFQALMTAGTAVFSNHSPPPDLADLVGQIAPRPVFLIHAEKSQGGEELNSAYYDAAEQPKAVWKVPGSTHTGGIEARPEEYERRVVGFFDRALAAR